MEIEQMHHAIKELEGVIARKGLKPYVSGYVSFMGDEFAVQVGAAEPSDDKGNKWSSSKYFQGKIGEESETLRDAFAFAHSFPGIHSEGALQ